MQGQGIGCGYDFYGYDGGYAKHTVAPPPRPTTGCCDPIPTTCSSNVADGCCQWTSNAVNCVYNFTRWTSNNFSNIDSNYKWTSNLAVWASNALSNSSGGKTTPGALSSSTFKMGTTSLTINATELDVPGCTVTFTTTQTMDLDITAEALIVSSDNTKSAQGIAYLYLDGAVLTSKYWSVASGGTLVNLPVPATMSFTAVKVAPGTHTLKISAKTWFGTGIVNYAPVNYVGYQSTDSQAMKSFIKVNQFVSDLS